MKQSFGSLLRADRIAAIEGLGLTSLPMRLRDVSSRRRLDALQRKVAYLCSMAAIAAKRQLPP
jgi:hypothetical protein